MHTHAGSTASLFRRFLLSFFGDIFIYPFLSLSLSSVSLLGDTCRNTLYPLRNTRIQEIKKYKERTIQERKTSCNVKQCQCQSIVNCLSCPAIQRWFHLVPNHGTFILGKQPLHNHRNSITIWNSSKQNGTKATQLIDSQWGFFTPAKMSGGRTRAWLAGRGHVHRRVHRWVAKVGN